MLSKPQDCGCGGGKYNCITKKAMKRWVSAELKRLDCGCGCKGRKGFNAKYGLIGGGILADCPPGWQTDKLTCVAPCNDDEFSDPLTCRKKCAPGQNDDGLTCRNPIQSKMNDCPSGSRDIAGTCWGPVRQDCVHDCFKHPAPGCRTYECGRLKGLFGEDWGPKLCTDCDLNCGKTCWNVDGITKQLHERDLKVWGGEVNTQAIRTREVRGRVDFQELGNAVKTGFEDAFSADGALAKMFDPEKNGVGAAFRKFGDDMKSVLEEIGRNIKAGFDKMGADAKAAFEEFARNAERDFAHFGDEFVKMMKDPMFWAEVVGVLAMVAGAALAIGLTVVTAGIGAPAAVGLMAACAMAGPAAKMIAKASMGQPIDGLDVANLLVSGASAMVPGLSGIVQTAVKIGTTAASVCITCVQAGQALGMIPSTCITNCPPPPPPFPPAPAPEIPDYPVKPPSPPEQLSFDDIAKLQPENTIKFKNGKNPDYIKQIDWVARYRTEHYGTPTGSGMFDVLRTQNDDAINNITNINFPKSSPINIANVKTPNPVEGVDEFSTVPTGGRRGGAGELAVIDKGNNFSNFWGSDQDKAYSNLKDPYGDPFNARCYASNYPDLANMLGNDEQKLTSWYATKGKAEGDDPSCIFFVPDAARTNEFNKCAELAPTVKNAWGVDVVDQSSNSPCYKYSSRSAWIDFLKRNPGEVDRIRKDYNENMWLRNEYNKCNPPTATSWGSFGAIGFNQTLKSTSPCYKYSNKENWNKYIETHPEEAGNFGKGKPKSLTLYHADWCHFCTELLPIWKKLGASYKGISINAIEEKQNKSFRVDGYPTIVYRNGSTIEKYTGERTKSGIINFLKSKL